MDERAAEALGMIVDGATYCPRESGSNKKANSPHMIPDLFIIIIFSILELIKTVLIYQYLIMCGGGDECG